MEETTGIFGLFSGGMGCLFSPLVVAAILLPVFMQAKSAAVKTNCLSRVKQLSTAAIIYSSDFDDKLPAASAWETRLFPYTKAESLFHCPEVTKAGKSHGYAFSKALSGASLVSVEEPQLTPMIFDATKLEKNAFGGLDLLPKPGRHSGGNALGYADGHAKFLKN